MTREDDLKRDSVRLEAAFFVGVDGKLLEELRKTSEQQQRLQELRDVVRVKDPAFLSRLDTLGVRPETALAVTLIPLVFVAWADGALDERERGAVLDAAKARGVAAERIAQQLLSSWLAKPPDPRLFLIWKTYVRRLWGCFTADERWQMRQNLLRSAREVAEAAGGFLGIASGLSAEERRVLEGIEKLLD
jgi:tellurite resistance protein